MSDVTTNRQSLGTPIRVHVGVHNEATRTWSVAFSVSQLRTSGIAAGCAVTLNVQGARIGGLVAWKGHQAWLATQGSEEWCYRRNTDALRAVGLTAPSDQEATIFTVAELSTPTADQDELALMTHQLRGMLSKPPAGNTNPLRVASSAGLRHQRLASVQAWVLDRAAGTCEACHQLGPFKCDDGAFFLEVHHINPLASGGPDTIENTAAVCPNCHRALHLAHNRADLAERLRAGLLRSQTT